MLRTLIAAATLALTLFAPGFVSPAAASPGWVVGGAFHIGGLFFSIGYHAHPYAAPVYYYRTRARLAYPGYHCSSACYLDHGVFYHHESCPVVLHYLALHGVGIDDLFVRFAPGYDGRYRGYMAFWDGPRVYYRYERYRGYRGYGRYDRSDPYERRYGRRYDRDRRFDRDRDRRFDRDRGRRFDRDRGRRFDRDRDRRYDRDRRTDRDRRGHRRDDRDRRRHRHGG